MKKTTQASAIALVCALALGAAQAQDSGSSQGNTDAKQQAATSTTQKQQKQQQKPPAAVLLLEPVNMAGDNLANGCWVRFYDGTDYRGASLTLAGPVDMPKMDVPGSAWKDWDSAVVGPKATVVTFDNENFRDRTARLAPGLHARDLRDSKLGWFEEVHSARVLCAS